MYRLVNTKVEDLSVYPLSLEISRRSCNSEDIDRKLLGSLNTFSKLGIYFHVVITRFLAFYYIISFSKD